MKEIAEDPSLRKTGTVVEVDHPTRGKYLSVGNPIKLSDSITEVKRSPLLGEHTDEILPTVLRFTSREIAEIKGIRRDRRRRAKAPSKKPWQRSKNRCASSSMASRPSARPCWKRCSKRGDDVVAVYVAPGEARPEGRSAQGSGARGQAAGLPAGILPQARGLGGVQGAQARPAGHGLRDPVRARGVPEHPDARLDPVSPVAAAGLSRRHRPSTGRSSWARRRPACRSSGPTTASIPAPCCCRRRRRSAQTTRWARSTSTACSRWASRRCWNRSTW